MLTLTAGSIIGHRYRILRPLTASVPGRSYLAEFYPEPLRLVTVHLLTRPEGPGGPPDRLRREFSLLRRLQHPNLDTPLDLGLLSDGTTPYLVDEFRESEDIAGCSEDWSVSQTIEAFAVVCRVLHYLHSRDIAHQGLMPENILVPDKAHPARDLKLVNIGMSRMLGDLAEAERPGLVPYLAPEILLGRPATSKSDLYSLGVVLYRLLAGRLPFDDQDTGFLIQKQLQGSPDTRALECLEYGAGLAQVVRGLLEKDPLKRPSSAEEVLRLLSAATGENHVRDDSDGVEGYFIASRLVGRSSEMKFLRERASQVRETGRGTTVYLIGEAGIGKSRIMEEFRIWALSEGWRVLEGGCRRAYDKSYGPFREVLSSTGGLDGEDTSSDGSGGFGFQPGVGISEAAILEVSGESAAGRFRDLLTREILGRVGAVPTVILLHDFHWADQATVVVLDYLTSDLQANPLLLCVSLRTEGSESGSLAQLMERSLRRMRAETLRLEPLSRESVQDLITGMTGAPELAAEIVPWVHERSGGNAFFLEEILRHLVDRGFLERGPNSWKFKAEMIGGFEVPASIAKVLRHRFSQMSRGAKTLARWMAVFQRALPHSLLQEVSRGSRTSVDRALNELLSRQIARTTTIQGESCYEFNHALVAEVIRAEMPARRRREMHARFGELLEAGESGDFREIALHFTEAQLGEKALEYAWRAASAFKAEYSNEKALKYYDYVLKHSSGLPPEQLCNAAVEAADVYCAVGKAWDATSLLLRILSVVRSRFLRSILELKLSQSYQCLGDIDRTEYVATRGLKHLNNSAYTGDDVILPVRARLLSQLAFCALNLSQPRKGLRLLSRALDGLLDDRYAVLQGAIHTLSSALFRVACELQHGVKAGESAVALLKPLDADHVLSIAYSNLGSNLTALGKFKLAILRHEAAVGTSARTRSVILMSQALSNLAECQCRMGEIKSARATSEKALNLIAQTNNPLLYHQVAATLVEIQICLADYTAAQQYVKQLTAIMNKRTAVFSRGHVHYLAAWLRIELGDWSGALFHLEKLKQMESNDAPIFETDLGETLRARILLAKGNIEKALEVLVTVDNGLKKKKCDYTTCLVRLWMSEAYFAQAKLSDALRCGHQALRLAKEMPSRQLQSHSHLVIGRVFGSRHRLVLDRRESHRSDGRVTMSRCVRIANAHLSTASKLAEDSGFLELAWLAYAELARVSELEGIPKSCLEYAKKALECYSMIENRIPKETLDSYRRLEMKQELVEECRRIIDMYGSPQTETRIEGLEAEHFRSLYRVSSAINSIKDMDRLLHVISDLLIEAVGAQRALVFLLHEDTGELRYAKGRNDQGESIEHADAASMSLAESVFRQGNPLVSANIQADPRIYDRNFALPDRSGTLLCGLLRIGDRVIGVLYADHTLPNVYLGESTINLFAAFCNLSAVAIDNAQTHQYLLEEKNELERHLSRLSNRTVDIIGKSAAIGSLLERIALAARSPLNMVISGESGTGKELVARALYRSGRRADRRFVALDCGSLSDNLVESELFGVRKGAYTGATESRAGLLESAHGGILFLDEITNLSLRLQGKLLRVLEDGEVRRLGDTESRKIDVQVIAATNKTLLKEVRRGRFRADLYYRLNGIEIQVPSLRERSEDIPLLAQWFLEQTSKIEEGKRKVLSAKASEILRRYAFPGNVRQLKNIVQGCYYLAPGRVIRPEHLPVEVMSVGDEEMGGMGLTLRGDSIFRRITGGSGTFADSVKSPFRKRRIGSPTVQRVIHLALTATRGRYRDAFRLLKIPEKDYAPMMIFLKRNHCYLDFRPYRKGG